MSTYLKNLKPAHHDKLLSILDDHSLRIVGKLDGGHMGSLILKCHRQADDSWWVVKICTNAESAKEITSNIYGYRAIREIGGGGIIPNEIVISQGDFVGIILPYFGSSISESLLQEKADFNIDNFLSYIEEKLSISEQATSQHQLVALQYLLASIATCYEDLHEQRILSAADVQIIHTINVKGMVSNSAMLFLLDFTPDNVFSNDSGFHYIDPWKQPTYKGSFIPSLGQFLTLSRDVYQLPTSKHWSEAFDATVQAIGNKLGLENGQATAQFALGTALQFGLSAQVRCANEKELATTLSKRGVAALQSVLT